MTRTVIDRAIEPTDPKRRSRIALRWIAGLLTNKRDRRAAAKGTSVPIPKFVSICDTFGTNFGIEGTLANLSFQCRF